MQKNRSIHMINRVVLVAVLGILFLLFVGGSLLSLSMHLNSPTPNIDDWVESWLQNFSTEMLGGFLTFILLQLVFGGRQQREAELKAEGQLKQQLIIKMRSKDNGIALQGVEELRLHGWLEDDSLQGANLEEANLQGANLTSANLQGANLYMASLQGANLGGAKLQRADLMGAKLYGADLMAAKLQRADLRRAKFDEKTNLPNNLPWTPETDMAEFTQPDNEDESK